MEIVVKRIYEAPEAADGYRVLVDKLWPRGVSKARAELDEWCKNISPSPDLRIWFGHKAERFAEFSERYRTELEAAGVPQELLARATTSGNNQLTLLYAAKDPEINHALVLRNYLMEVSSP